MGVYGEFSQGTRVSAERVGSLVAVEADGPLCYVGTIVELIEDRGYFLLREKNGTEQFLDFDGFRITHEW